MLRWSVLVPISSYGTYTSNFLEKYSQTGLYVVGYETISSPEGDY